MDEALSFFSDDPAQHVPNWWSRPRESHERLMLAVLKDAIDCFQRHAHVSNGKRDQLFLEAQDWILQRDSDWPFSFENICNVLRLDPDYIRSGLLKKHPIGAVDCPNRRRRTRLRTLAGKSIQQESRRQRLERFMSEDGGREHNPNGPERFGKRGVVRRLR